MYNAGNNFLTIKPMEQNEIKKSNLGVIILTVVITALVVGGGVYYLEPESAPAILVEENDTIEKEERTPEMSLLEYYKTRRDSEIGYNDMHGTPEEMGFQEIARVEVACLENADGPCGFDLIILSEDSLHAGDQEFYLSEEGGVGYTYYGSFTDDLERIVDEANTIESLKEIQ